MPPWGALWNAEKLEREGKEALTLLLKNCMQRPVSKNELICLQMIASLSGLIFPYLVSGILDDSFLSEM